MTEQTPQDDIVIEPGRDEHGPALAALIEPIFLEYEGVLFDLEEMPELEHIATTFDEAGGAFYCALRGERLVGCIGWTPAKDGRGIELKKLYVANDQRRAKLGHRLANLVEQAARERHDQFVELWSDVKFAAAHRFYEARGYRRDGNTRELHDKSDTVEYYFRLRLAESIKD